MLTWSISYGFTNSAGACSLAKTYTKHYVLILILSTQDCTKLLKQLDSRFKQTINCNKYQSKVSATVQNQYSDYLVDLGFPRVYRFFVTLFEGNQDRTVNTPVGNNIRSYWNIRKITKGQGDNYTTNSLPDYPYFKEALISTCCWSKIDTVN